jgi:hypothetical protein
MNTLLQKYQTAFDALDLIARGAESAKSIAKVAMQECVNLGDSSEDPQAEKLREYRSALVVIENTTGNEDHKKMIRAVLGVPAGDPV